MRSDPKRDYCYGVEDGLDGYCVHAKGCRSYGRSWTGPNFDCIKPGPNRERRWVCTCGHPGLGCYCRV